MSAPVLKTCRRLHPSVAVGWLLGCALVLSACANTLPNRGQVVMRDVNFPLRDFRLPSGLRVVVEEDRRSPVVAVVAVVGVGGSNDPAGKEGLAHVVEHLAFRARHSGSPSVWTRLEQVGAGHFNAFTSLDHTAYETLVNQGVVSGGVYANAGNLGLPAVTPNCTISATAPAGGDSRIRCTLMGATAVRNKYIDLVRDSSGSWRCVSDLKPSYMPRSCSPG